MKLSSSDQSAYSALAYYLRVNMPEVAKVPAIVNAIKGLSGKTSTTVIKNAMKWGQGPEIKIVTDLRGSDGGKAYGLYQWGSNVLQIDRKLVQDFCNGKGIVTTKGGRRIYLVGATILHELTHWADAQDGVDDIIPGHPENEEGEEYERNVYGHVTG